jgi:hypothetical protein
MFDRSLDTLGSPDILTSDDLQLSLYLCYELHYRGFDAVSERWEWEPSLLTLRARLEAAFEEGLTAVVGRPEAIENPPSVELWELVERSDGPSLSAFMEEHGTLRQMREFAVHRSAYQLKEADPHTWALPRLAGAAQATMAAIQYDEYGSGRADQRHSELFRSTLTGLGLDDAYGAHLDVIPGVTLATVNLMSLFGLHRRWRGALLGHLAAFEMTSVAPMGRYSRALDRLGLPADARTFYEVHVVADAEHQHMAGTMVDAFATAHPDLAGDVVFGARSLFALEERFASHLLDAWQSGRTSLLRPL